MKRRFWIFYILLFCVCMLLLSLAYPHIESYAMAHRESGAPGGEMLLLLVPFMAVFTADTARQWKRRRSKRGIY